MEERCSTTRLVSVWSAQISFSSGYSKLVPLLLLVRAQCRQAVTFRLLVKSYVCRSVYALLVFDSTIVNYDFVQVCMYT